MSTILCLQDVAQAQKFYANGFWRKDTFYTLLRGHAERTPEHFALRDFNSRLTYRELLGWVDALAESLHGAGLREGDRVSVWLPNRVELAIVLLACSRMGYVCNPSLHRDYTCEEVVGLLKRIGTAAFIGQTGYGSDADRSNIFAMFSALPQIKKAYQLSPTGTEPGDGDFQERFEGLRPLVSALPHRIDPDRIMYLAFTSGTTGQPKGVLHTDNTVLSNARSFVADWSFDAATIHYTMGAMSHNIGTVALANTLVCGAELVLHTPHDAKRALDRIVEVQATSVVCVPTYAIDVLTEVKKRGLEKIGNVSIFQVGGASVPPSVIRDLMKLGITPKNGFGMTENCSFLYTRPNNSPEVIANTCGKPCAGFETKIWNQENSDQEVTPGEIGELGTRGSSMMLGYFNDQQATECAYNKHGWFMTGDLARYDSNGNIQIVGRKKDLIIRGGHNIHPAKIEGYAMRHPGVVKAAAFPVPDQRLGERVCLAIIPRNVSVFPEEMLDHLDKQGLSKFDMPEFFVEMTSFPLTPSGKILKSALTNLVKTGAITPRPVRFSNQSSVN